MTWKARTKLVMYSEPGDLNLPYKYNSKRILRTSLSPQLSLLYRSEQHSVHPLRASCFFWFFFLYFLRGITNVIKACI